VSALLAALELAGMSAPTVCCVILVNGREAMVQRALAAFRAQTYPAKRLLIYDTSPVVDLWDTLGLVDDGDVEIIDSAAIDHHGRRKTIGHLRNRANHHAVSEGVDIIAHLDSDDWSHPRRLQEQVALLEASGKMCVGYRELLFWDTRPRRQSARYLRSSDSVMGWPGPGDYD
jgi:glycosyltransferase involved in cell wall biosynthesis